MSEYERFWEHFTSIREKLEAAIPSCVASTLEKARASIKAAKMSEYARKVVGAWLRDWERLEKKMAECDPSRGGPNGP